MDLRIFTLRRNDLEKSIFLIMDLIGKKKLTSEDLHSVYLLWDNSDKLVKELRKIPDFLEWSENQRLKSLRGE
jgi:hypothetical protein